MEARARKVQLAVVRRHVGAGSLEVLAVADRAVADARATRRLEGRRRQRDDLAVVLR